MWNGSYVRVLGAGTIDLKLTSGKTLWLRNVQYVPTIKKNLVSSSLMCRDKYGNFVGKVYDSGDLFRFSLSTDCNKVVDNIVNVDESIVWHLRLCHVNFGCMIRLANLSLISKFTLVKNSKCHVCVELEQLRKPHLVVEARNLAL